MGANELKRLCEVEEENAKLKQMYAEISLGNTVRDGQLKKALKPPERKSFVGYLVVKQGLSNMKARCVAAL